MSEVKLFENKEIRTIWDKEKEEWYFSVVDVVGVLAESKNPRRYWSDLKRKMRLTDVSNTQGILRIIQSIPSPKVEPFKMWLAEVGKERINEIINPELTIDRALETYLRKGYSKEWINQRLQSIQVRKELTDSWINHGIKKVMNLQFLQMKFLKHGVE